MEDDSDVFEMTKWSAQRTAATHVHLAIRQIKNSTQTVPLCCYLLGPHRHVLANNVIQQPMHLSASLSPDCKERAHKIIAAPWRVQDLNDDKSPGDLTGCPILF